MHDNAGDQADDPEAFDRRVGAVLDHEARMLRAKGELLLATGAATIERPAGTLRAALRLPRWWRPGVFRHWSVRRDGASSRGVLPLGRTADPAFLLSQLTLQLAVSVAWLDE